MSEETIPTMDEAMGQARQPELTGEQIPKDDRGQYENKPVVITNILKLPSQESQSGFVGIAEFYLQNDATQKLYTMPGGSAFITKAENAIKIKEKTGKAPFPFQGMFVWRESKKSGRDYRDIVDPDWEEKKEQ